MAIAEEAVKWQPIRLKLGTTMTPDVARGYIDGEGNRTFETFARDILEVKVESESRAVVVAVIKNTTPIPAGAEMTKYDEERRRDGERYRYILQRDSGSWRVAEIWEWETYPTPKWKKARPGDGKPSVPSLTYEGV